MRKDLVLGASALALSALYYGMALRIPESRLADAVGPAGLPKVYAVALAVLSGVLMLSAIARPGPTDRAVPDVPPDAARHRVWRVAGMLAIGVAYLASVSSLGYILALTGLILATTYCQGGAVNWRTAVVAIAGALFCWVLFVLLMRTPQPPGVWRSIL